LYHVLNTHLIELEQQGMEDWRVRKTIKEEKAVADAEIEEYQQRLVNLVMWTLDHYFPASHAHATWKRLTPFFHLPGVVTQGRNTVEVALRPFNDKRYNQDLEALCERVNAVAPRLPDGRRLHVSVQTNALVRPILDMQKRRVA
jgi:hypothetical protein